MNPGVPTPGEAEAFWSLRSSPGSDIDAPDRADYVFLMRSYDPSSEIPMIEDKGVRHRSLRRLARVWLDQNFPGDAALREALEEWDIAKVHFNEVVLQSVQVTQNMPNPDSERTRCLFMHAPATNNDIVLAYANAQLLEMAALATPSSQGRESPTIAG